MNQYPFGCISDRKPLFIWCILNKKLLILQLKHFGPPLPLIWNIFSFHPTSLFPLKTSLSKKHCILMWCCWVIWIFENCVNFKVRFYRYKNTLWKALLKHLKSIYKKNGIELKTTYIVFFIYILFLIVFPMKPPSGETPLMLLLWCVACPCCCCCRCCILPQQQQQWQQKHQQEQQQRTFVSFVRWLALCVSVSQCVCVSVYTVLHFHRFNLSDYDISQTHTHTQAQRKTHPKVGGVSRRVG